ncbi:MAG: Uma2 family endonuclease [Chloroflexota bacterium]|nr:MAG: Uma2 family endonuclease [Chloroflexota bacterium]
MPDDGKRYEIIGGELYVSRQPSTEHQLVCSAATWALEAWSRATGVGSAIAAPGLVFADDDDVAPDLIWISRERLATALGQDGHLHSAPELVVEVLSPGAANTRRDREVKLTLYSRRGVREYWIIDGPNRRVEIYRRENLALVLAATLDEPDTLTSPLMPGFVLTLDVLFATAARV